MNLSVVKHTDKVYPYGLGNFMHLALKIFTFGYTVYLAMQKWSIAAVFYVALIYYWIWNIDSAMAVLKHELLYKKKHGKQYENLVKLSFSNPHLRCYYKMMYIVLFILILKVAGSFVGSMNYIKFKAGLKTQLMYDLEVSIEEVSPSDAEHLHVQDPPAQHHQRDCDAASHLGHPRHGDQHSHIHQRDHPKLHGCLWKRMGFVG
jgi:hypothetical protein